MMRNEYRHDFLYAFFSPTPSLLGVYAVGLVALSLFSNLVYGALTAPGSILLLNALAVLGLVILLFLVAFALWKRHRSLKFVWKDGKEIGKHKALVTTVSTPDIIHKLLKYHAPVLRHVWLITNFKQDPYAYFADQTLPDIKNALKQEGINTDFEEHLVHFESSEPGSQRTYEAVKQAFHEALEGYDLKREEIVADITSGTKEMTAGVVLACAVHGWKMSYLRSDYEWDDAQKRDIRLEGTEKVIEFDVSFLRPSVVADTSQ
jgi:hypothetical protein